MNKSQDFEIYKDQFKLTEEVLISFIQGKALVFMVAGKFHVEVLPPNYGVMVKNEDWVKIATFLRCASYPDSHFVEGLIEKIEGRK